MATHWIEIEGKTYKVELPEEGQPRVDGIVLQVDVRLLQPGVLSVLLTDVDGTRQSFACVQDARPEGLGVLVQGRRIAYAPADPRSLKTAAGAGGETGPRPLKAPMPGRIVRVLVAEGDAVEAGQGCVVIEAMKMQNELKAPRAGVVTRLRATVGETVAANAVLLVVDGQWAG